jgi:hypothetical protein
MRFRSLIIFLVLLAPSARYALKNQDMPQFEGSHDDGLLFVSAKSLATGEGFHILSLPQQPAQTKYPVLYPLYLAAVWKLNPDFPDNLRLATLFGWALIAICLALAFATYKKEGLGEFRSWVLTGLLAMSPYMLLFGCRPFSELFFTCWLLGTLLIARREGIGMAALAGVCAGCAFLSRSAGLPLLIAVPALYLWRRERARAIAFAAAMLPLILGWMLWSRTHILHTSDPTLLYYTDYFRYQLLNVQFANLHVIVWKNADELLFRLGSLFLPNLVGIQIIRILVQVLAIAMISGVVRLARSGVMVPYALFAGLSAAILLVWHGIDERLVLPLYPLLIAGLLTELEHLATMIRGALRHKDLSQRIVAGGFAGITALILLAALATQGYLSFFYLDEVNQIDREKLAARRDAYKWIATNTPATATILSNDDPLLYLYTGRRGNGIFPLMRDLYYGDTKSTVLNSYRDVVPLAHRQGLDYFYSCTSDLSRWVVAPGVEDEMQALLHSNPALHPLFTSKSGTLYKVGDQ